MLYIHYTYYIYIYIYILYIQYIHKCNMCIYNSIYKHTHLRIYMRSSE